VEKLMSHAKNQYMEMVRAKEWTATPNENEEILALTAEIKALKDQYLSGETDNQNRNSEHNKNAWRKVAPKNEEPQTKEKPSIGAHTTKHGAFTSPASVT